MLYLVFTVDGDWNAYFNVKLPEKARSLKVDIMERLIRNEIDTTKTNLDGKFIHFIHTSPRARNDFLKEPFLGLWKEIIENGGDVGLHCHADDPYREYYYQDTAYMKKLIPERINAFRDVGLDIKCYRGGFLGFSAETVSILEDCGIRYDFSCEPGRHLIDNGELVCNWRGSPRSIYRMSHKDHRKIGDSRVFEVPLGGSGGKCLYFGRSNLEELRDAAKLLKEESNKCDIIVSVLTHSGGYEGKKKIKELEEKIAMLKKYGQFISLEELSSRLPRHF